MSPTYSNSSKKCMYVSTYMFTYCCSVTRSCPTLCDPMDCSTPGLPTPHHLLEFAQVHVHWISDAIQSSHPLLLPSPPALNLSQHQGLFQQVTSSHQVAKVLELQHQSFQWVFRVCVHRYIHTHTEKTNGRNVNNKWIWIKLYGILYYYFWNFLQFWNSIKISFKNWKRLFKDTGHDMRSGGLYSGAKTWPSGSQYRVMRRGTWERWLCHNAEEED